MTAKETICIDSVNIPAAKNTIARINIKLKTRGRTFKKNNIPNNPAEAEQKDKPAKEGSENQALGRESNPFWPANQALMHRRVAALLAMTSSDRPSRTLHAARPDGS